MSFHLEAKDNEIAPRVLLPGDPLRAKYIAEKFFENAQCYNNVRNMLGFTGTYKGKSVSVQATGMGIPSTLIYANELIDKYGIKKMIRVGTCGAINSDLELNDIVLAQGACSDSNVNRRIFGGLDFAPIAHFELLKKAFDFLENKNINAKVGNILSTDTFYQVHPEELNIWRKYNVLAAEMESSALYTLAQEKKCEALSVLAVSDIIGKTQALSHQDKERKLDEIIEVALEVI